MGWGWLEKFSYETNGYNRQEVNQLIKEVIKNTESIIDKCKSQREDIKQLQKELAYYKRIENELKMMITKSEMLANDIKVMAQNEASDIIRKAQENADRIINESLLSAQDINNKREELIKNMKLFSQRLKEIIEQERKIAIEIDKIDI